MTQKKCYFNFLALIFTSASLVLLLNATHVVAQSNSTPKAPTLRPRNSSRKATRLKFTLPPKGAPGKRTDAASRSQCTAFNQRLVALVPPTNIGLTIASHPTFWFYIPYQDNSPVVGKFQLLDEEENVIYKTNISSSDIPGIVGVEIPQDISGLEVGKRYQWVLSFVCNQTSIEASTFVNGFVERVAITKRLQQKLKVTKIKRDRIFVYGEHGLWFDMLTTLINERRRNRQDVQLENDWRDLLSLPQVNLSQLVIFS